VVNNQSAEGSLIAMVNDYMAAMSYLETVKQSNYLPASKHSEILNH
jgi:hypothetical protein